MYDYVQTLFDSQNSKHVKTILNRNTHFQYIPAETGQQFGTLKLHHFTHAILLTSCLEKLGQLNVTVIMFNLRFLEKSR